MEQTFGKNTVIEEFPHGGIYDDKRFKTTFLPEENEKNSKLITTYLPEYDKKDVVFFDRRKLSKESKTKVFGLPVIKKLR